MPRYVITTPLTFMFPAVANHAAQRMCGYDEFQSLAFVGGRGGKDSVVPRQSPGTTEQTTPFYIPVLSTMICIRRSARLHHPD